MLKLTNYCQGCNEKFDVSSDGACPNCGQELFTLDSAPTADVGDLLARETHLGNASLDDQLDDKLVGSKFGNYQLEGLLGRGGMARVYRARHSTLHRPCAIKVISPRLIRSNPDYVDLFFNEARAAAALVHPHIVTIHNLGEVDSRHFIEMELVDGHTLQHILEREKRLGPVHAVEIMLQICKALAAAHSLGIVHRDLKPANVLLTTNGTAKLADFGLAKSVYGADLAHGAILKRSLVGTPYCMAPELFAHRPADERSDVYAAGITFAQLLLGRPPFLSRSLSELGKLHATARLPDLVPPDAHLSGSIQKLIERCLAKSPTDRYPNGGLLLADLRAIYGSIRDLHSLLTDALQDLDVSWHGERGNYEIEMRLEGGRHQRVFVQSSTRTPVSSRVLKIYSISAPLKADYMRRALELNASIPHASIAIDNIDGTPHFVVIQTYPRATCDTEEVRRSVLAVAHWADTVEHLLTGLDRF